MKKAFSLVEMLIALSIVVLIAALSFSLFSKEKIKVQAEKSVKQQVVAK